MADPNKPDITITDADLSKVDEQMKSAKDFFANPNPRLLKPTALVDVICTKTKRTFAAYFEQPKPNSWILVEYIDDTVINSPQYGRTATIQADLIKDNVDWSACGTKLRCPYCGALALVKCGKCNTLSCHPDGKPGSSFHCPHCGKNDKLSNDYIKTLDGSSGKKR